MIKEKSISFKPRTKSMNSSAVLNLYGSGAIDQTYKNRIQQIINYVSQNNLPTVSEVQQSKLFSGTDGFTTDDVTALQNLLSNVYDVNGDGVVDSSDVTRMGDVLESEDDKTWTGMGPPDQAITKLDLFDSVFDIDHDSSYFVKAVSGDLEWGISFYRDATEKEIAKVNKL